VSWLPSIYARQHSNVGNRPVGPQTFEDAYTLPSPEADGPPLRSGPSPLLTPKGVRLAPEGQVRVGSGWMDVDETWAPRRSVCGAGNRRWRCVGNRAKRMQGECQWRCSVGSPAKRMQARRLRERAVGNPGRRRRTVEHLSASRGQPGGMYAGREQLCASRGSWRRREQARHPERCSTGGHPRRVRQRTLWRRESSGGWASRSESQRERSQRRVWRRV